MKPSLLAFALVLLILLTHAPAPAAEPTSQAATQPAPQAVPITQFPLRDGDIWVMVGDSITWQNHYTVYLEAFTRARYPKLKFATVNSGRSGEVFIQGIIRFKHSIAPYKPTFITAAYGMNDHTKTFPGELHFLDDPKSSPQRFIDAARATKARVVLVSASPLIAPPDYSTDGGKFQIEGTPGERKVVPPGWRSNPANKLFAEKVAILAARNGLPFVDQMTTLQTVWASNFRRDLFVALCARLRPLLETPITAENVKTRGEAISAQLRPTLDNDEAFEAWIAPAKDALRTQWRKPRTDSVEYYESLRLHLRDWLAQIDAATPAFVRISGYTDSARASDLIHPNQAGHLHMAGVIFKQLAADGLVSEVTIDAPTAKVIAARKAGVSAVKFESGVLTFTRLDECLPLPIADVARPALGVDVDTPLGNPRDLFGMSRYLLTVKNLPAGNYELSIDGEAVAMVTAEELARGFDAGLLSKGPIAAQCKRLLDAVQAGSIVAVNIKGDGNPVVPAEPRILSESEPSPHTWRLTRK